MWRSPGGRRAEDGLWVLHQLVRSERRRVMGLAPVRSTLNLGESRGKPAPNVIDVPYGHVMPIANVLELHNGLYDWRNGPGGAKMAVQDGAAWVGCLHKHVGAGRHARTVAFGALVDTHQIHFLKWKTPCPK